jgi:hypothetical protein
MSYNNGKLYVFEDQAGNINIWTDNASKHKNSVWATGRKNPNGVCVPKKDIIDILTKIIDRGKNV